MRPRPTDFTLLTCTVLYNRSYNISFIEYSLFETQNNAHVSFLVAGILRRMRESAGRVLQTMSPSLVQYTHPFIRYRGSSVVQPSDWVRWFLHRNCIGPCPLLDLKLRLHEREASTLQSTLRFNEVMLPRRFHSITTLKTIRTIWQISIQR